MSLQTYLDNYYQNELQFAKACTITLVELDNLLSEQLIPQPSYTVLSDKKCISQAFGELHSKGLLCGKYFHPLNKTWVTLAIETKNKVGLDKAHAVLKKRFTKNFSSELEILNTTIFRLVDSFTENGDIISARLTQRTEAAWGFFLKGIFSLCVADPSTEITIATKEVLQEALITLTNNAQNTDLDTHTKRHVLTLIDQYQASAMPFSPLEYPNSSRKRLVEDLRAKLISA